MYLSYLFTSLSVSVLASAAIISKRSSVSTTNLPSGWAYQGCYSDSVSHRVLSGASYASGTSMTDEGCMTYCAGAGFPVAGVEYSQECYCDYELDASASKEAETDCNMPCSGNSSELCGGSNRLNVYQLSTSTKPSPEPIPTGWSALGCFTDNVSMRTLSQGQAVAGGYTNMSVANCISACQSAGYGLAGLEYSQECFCDNKLQNEGVCASDQTTCNMRCKGNSAGTCGGPNRLSMYGSSNAVAPCSEQ